MPTHTEEEFKKLLKNLFAEKKRVKELKKRLEGSTLQKSFQAKLSDIQKLAVTDEVAQLKTLYAAKEKECAELKMQLSQVKPALRKLAEKLQIKDKELACSLEQEKKEAAQRMQQIEEIENNKEQLLEQAYREMRGLSRKNADLIEENASLEHKIEECAEFKKKLAEFEELGEDVKRAQTHLAKKVKETTILQDLVERQKLQVEENLEQMARMKAEVERLQNSLQLQKMHEEKLELLAKERSASAELATKEWQDKYLAAQEEIAQQKRQLEELEKLKKEYSDMAAKFSNLKSVLNAQNSSC